MQGADRSVSQPFDLRGWWRRTGERADDHQDGAGNEQNAGRVQEVEIADGREPRRVRDLVGAEERLAGELNMPSTKPPASAHTAPRPFKRFHNIPNRNTAVIGGAR